MRVLLILAASLLAAMPRAEACVAMPPSLLERPATASASRVLFEVDPAGSITQTMDVVYEGSPRDFGWLIPVPAAAEDVDVSVAARGALEALDSWTRLSFERSCERSQRRQSSGCGFAGDSGMLRSAGGMPNGVTVVQTGHAGPYAFSVIESGDGAALMEWLGDEEIALSQAARPVIDAVIARGGGSWVAVKISNDASIGQADGDTLKPLSLTFPGRVPSLAMQLSAISMQPEMTQVVFIAASEQYEASGWSNLSLKPEQLYDAQTQTHYGAWLAKVIDDAGGTAFVTELAAPFRELERPNRFMSEDDGEEGVDIFLNRLREDHSHLTRLVTRVSPWEVDSNPMFVPAPETGLNASRLVDLSDHRRNCEPAALPACAANYCGKDAQCGLDDQGRAGCLCPEGHAAQRIAHPFVQDTFEVVCRPIGAAFNMIPEVQWEDEMPCACEGGTCAMISGASVCICPDGQAAFVQDSGSLSCSVPASSSTITAAMAPRLLAHLAVVVAPRDFRAHLNLRC